jgi:hypothetical protein
MRLVRRVRDCQTLSHHSYTHLADDSRTHLADDFGTILCRRPSQLPSPTAEATARSISQIGSPKSDFGIPCPFTFEGSRLPSTEFNDQFAKLENKVVSKSGRHHPSFRHSLTPEVDPWGTVVYSCNFFTGVILFDSKLSAALAANRG